MSDRHPPTAGPAAPAIGYVLTHHPRTTQTFIEAEIEALRRRGTTVAVFAMNEPAADQLRTDAARTERSSTSYLKAAGGRGVVRAVA